MEHPIPQDVTGFQFKLIGNMTLRQFAYLAGGSILAWVFFSIPLHSLIKFPLAGFFAFLGVALAFLPIEQRPMDIMLRNFIKALFNPNQYIFQKAGGILVIESHSLPKKQKKDTAFTSLPKEKLEKYLKTIPKISHNRIDEKESNFLSTLSMMIKSGGVLLQPQHASPPSPLLNTSPRIITIEEEMKFKKKLEPHFDEPKKEEIKATPPPKPVPLPPPPKPVQKERVVTAEEVHQKALDLQDQLNETLLAKQKLEQDLLNMQKKFEEHKKNVLTPSAAPQKTPTQNVRIVTTGSAKDTGLPIAPQDPNIITGIIKDARGNILSNILVEIKDTDDNPVRAFKTNALGQFAAVTPLMNGTYTISFEDPMGKHTFDSVEIAAEGNIISPLEVISQDQREQLRKELFGAN